MSPTEKIELASNTTPLFLKNIWDYIGENIVEWIMVLVIFLVGILVIKIIKKFVSRIFDKTNFDRTLEIFFEKLIGVFLWAILIVMVLSNMGFDVTGFIAGLSIAGFVVGFATKDVLSNFAAGIFLLMNSPFKVDEKVTVANVKGVVKEINIGACIIVTEEDAYVTVPNSKIWGGPIVNMSRMKKDEEKKKVVLKKKESGTKKKI